MRLVMQWQHLIARSVSEFSPLKTKFFCLPQVRVLGTGLTLFLFLPAAFVDVDTTQLEVNWISWVITFMDYN